MLVDIIKAASSSPYAPTVIELRKRAKQTRPPAYFIFDQSKTLIDIEHKSWIELLRRNEVKKRISTSGNKQESKESPESKELQILEAESLRADYNITIEKLKKIKLGNEQIEIELAKQKGSLVPYEMANWLFISFMEATNTELLRLPKKLEADIINFCRDNNATGIIELYNRQTSAIIQAVKDNQKKALKEWRESFKSDV